MTNIHEKDNELNIIRKKYCRPKLTSYGSLQALTAGATSNAQTENSQGNPSWKKQRT